jgi:hypothetical protein
MVAARHRNRRSDGWAKSRFQLINAHRQSDFWSMRTSTIETLLLLDEELASIGQDHIRLRHVRRNQAARPTGESTIPYNVCARSPSGTRRRFPFDIRTANARKRPSHRRETRWRRRTEKSRLVNVDWKDARHVGVNAAQLRRRLHAHLIDDDRAPIASLRHEFCVSEALHQYDPGTRDVGSIPPGGSRFARVSVARHYGITRWNLGEVCEILPIGLIGILYFPFVKRLYL